MCTHFPLPWCSSIIQPSGGHLRAFKFLKMGLTDGCHIRLLAQTLAPLPPLTKRDISVTGSTLLVSVLLALGKGPF